MFKRIIFPLLFFFIPLFCPAASCDDGTQIIIEVKGDVAGSPHHRVPLVVPIRCSYNSELNSVFVEFVSKIGDIDVVIANRTSGEFIETTISSEESIQMIPCPGGDGICSITFYLPNRKSYYGEFVL